MIILKFWVKKSKINWVSKFNLNFSYIANGLHIPKKKTLPSLTTLKVAESCVNWMLQKLQNPLDSALLTRYSFQKSTLKQQIEADIQNRKSELKKPPIIQKKTGQEVDVLENPEIPVSTTDNGKSFFSLFARRQ